MSVGFYALPAGGIDPQTPHHEDEVYYVIRGRAMVSIDGKDRRVEAGSTIFVAKEVEHRFHTVTEALELLVVFAPAESSDPGPPEPPRPEPASGRHRPGKGS